MERGKDNKKFARELADKLAELIEQELESKYAPGLIMHEDEITTFLMLRDLVYRRNPIEGQALNALRVGLDEIWDESKVLTGQHMALLARALDIAHKHDEDIKASEESIYKNE